MLPLRVSAAGRVLRTAGRTTFGVACAHTVNQLRSSPRRRVSGSVLSRCGPLTPQRCQRRPCVLRPRGSPLPHRWVASLHYSARRSLGALKDNGARRKTKRDDPQQQEKQKQEQGQGQGRGGGRGRGQQSSPHWSLALVRGLIPVVVLMATAAGVSHWYRNHRRELLDELAELQSLGLSIGRVATDGDMEGSVPKAPLKELQLFVLLRALPDLSPTKQCWVLRRIAHMLQQDTPAPGDDMERTKSVPRNYQLFVASGGVDVLTELVLRARTSPAVRAEVVHIFNTLVAIDDDEAVKLLLRRGGLPLVGAVLFTYDDVHPSLRRWDTVKHELGLRSAGGETESVAVLAALLDRDASDATLQRALADADSCLIPLLLSLSHAEHVGQARSDLQYVRQVYDQWEMQEESRSTPVFDVENLVDYLHDTMLDEHSTREVYYHSIRALATLADVVGNHDKIASRGGVALLWRVLEEHVQEPRVQLQAVRALANMCRDQRVARDILAHDLLPLVLHWLDDEHSSQELQCQCARLLINLQSACTRPARKLEAVQPAASGEDQQHPFLSDSVVSLSLPWRSVQRDRRWGPSALGGFRHMGDFVDDDAPALECGYREDTRELEYDVDVVFVHGLLGNAVTTWRPSDVPAVPLADKNSLALETPATRVPTIGAAVARAEKEAVKMDAVADNARCTEGGKDEAEAMLIQPVVAQQGASTECWPRQWLLHDICGQHGDVRILSLNYRSFLSAWSGEQRTLADRSARSLHNLQQAHVGKPSAGSRRPKKVVFVCHSMGGLLVKHMLRAAAQDPSQRYSHILNQTVGLVFFSTPHFGSFLPDLARYVPRVVYTPSQEVVELHRENVALGPLNDFFRSLRGIQVLSFGESLATPLRLTRNIVSTQIVPLDSSNPGFGEFVEVADTHYGICKPAHRRDPVYTKLVSFLDATLHASENSRSERELMDKLRTYLKMPPPKRA